MAQKKSNKRSAAMEEYHMKAIGLGIACCIVAVIALVLGILTDSPAPSFQGGFSPRARVSFSGFDSYSEYRGYFSILLLDRTNMILFAILLLAFGICACFKFLWAIYLATSMFAVLFIVKMLTIMTAALMEQWKPAGIAFGVWVILGGLVGFGYYVGINGQETIRMYKKKK